MASKKKAERATGIDFTFQLWRRGGELYFLLKLAICVRAGMPGAGR